MERVGGSRRKRGARRGWGVLVVVLAILGSMAWWWNRRSGDAPDERIQLRVRQALTKAEMADRSDWLTRFAWPGPHVEALATRLEGNSEEALLDALRARLEAERKAGRWAPAPVHEPARGPVRSAEDVAELLEGRQRHGEGNGEAKPPRLGSLELAALGVAVLRSRGYEAALAQAWAWRGAREPADPTGIRGAHGVAWGGSRAHWATVAPGGSEPEQGAWRALDGAGEVAAVLVVEGARLLVHDGRLEEALVRAQLAVTLDPRSAPARLLFGLAQVQSGNPQAGLQAIEAARRLGQGPASELLSGTVALATGDLDGAARAFTGALAAAPDYAEAHALLGAVHLARGDVEEARAAVAQAKKLAPELPSLPMLEAELALRDGDPSEAVRHAREAVQRRPKQWDVHLQAGRIYRMAGDYDAMRRAARQALETAPSSRREMVRQLALRLLGPTAFDETSDEVIARADEEDSEALQLPDPDRLGTLQLDEPAPSVGGLGAPSAGGLQLGAPEPKLRLRDPDEDLRLQLRP